MDQLFPLSLRRFHISFNPTEEKPHLAHCSIIYLQSVVEHNQYIAIHNKQTDLGSGPVASSITETTLVNSIRVDAGTSAWPKLNAFSNCLIRAIDCRVLQGLRFCCVNDFIHRATSNQRRCNDVCKYFNHWGKHNGGLKALTSNSSGIISFVLFMSHQHGKKSSSNHADSGSEDSECF